MAHSRRTLAVLGVFAFTVPRVASAATPDADAAALAPATALLPPVLKERATAEYPIDALRDRVEGTVGLELSLDDTGRVTAARVTSPAGHGFDEAALAAAA